MLEGLLISLTGMVVCFIVLTILMCVIMGLERLFRDKVITEETAAKADFSYLTDLGENPILDDAAKLEPNAEPEDTSEVAAIAIALSSHLKKQGKKLGKPLIIAGAHYHVELSDISYTPITIVVNGEICRAALGEEGLPNAKQTPPISVPLTKTEPQRGLGWRSAYPPSQGSFWNRRGWTSKQ